MLSRETKGTLWAILFLVLWVLLMPAIIVVSTIAWFYDKLRLWRRKSISQNREFRRQETE
jgi:hypothetical protein